MRHRLRGGDSARESLGWGRQPQRDGRARGLPATCGTTVDNSTMTDQTAAMDERGPRRKLVRWERLGSTRFLTFSCYRRMQLFANPKIRDRFTASIGEAREQHRFRLLAWVVMPEHVHLVIVPRPVLGYRRGRALIASRDDVRTILWHLKKPFAEEVLGRWRELRAPILPKVRLAAGGYRFWQTGGGHDRNIRSEAKLWKTILYVHENPVERERVKKATDWAWSSARWYAGMFDGQLPIDMDHHEKWKPPERWVREAVEWEGDEKQSQ